MIASNIFLAKPAEVEQLHHSGAPLILLRQPPQRLVERQQLIQSNLPLLGLRPREWRS